MTNILSILFTAITLFVIASTSMTTDNKIVVKADYQQYLQATSPATTSRIVAINKRIAFWEQKLDKAPTNNHCKLHIAMLLAQRFEMNNSIKDIHQSDALLKSALENTVTRKANFYHILSSNALIRHDFKVAETYARMAMATKEALDESKFRLFDVLLETGQLLAAEKVLLSIRNHHRFDYQIRLAKLREQEGSLEDAIYILELAADWTKTANREADWIQVTHRLGDMYGRAGKIQQAYKTYLKFLAKDPNNHKALKRIAWMAYAHDKNIEQANELVDHLLIQYPSPDLYLFKAELAAYKGDYGKEESYIDAFILLSEQPIYGKLYHKDLAEIELDYSADLDKAKGYIENEMTNRPIAQSFLLQARYYAQLGLKKTAYDILASKVESHTTAPAILYRMGLLFQEIGKTKKAKQYLEVAAKATYELGPVKVDMIEKALMTL